jgi:hypothetical protein
MGMTGTRPKTRLAIAFPLVLGWSGAPAGAVLAAAASNLYYPVQDRGFGHTLNRIGLDMANTALFDVAAEFWPDIEQRLHHAFGRQ